MTFLKAQWTREKISTALAAIAIGSQSNSPAVILSDLARLWYNWPLPYHQAMVCHRSSMLHQVEHSTGEAVRVLTEPFPFPSHLIQNVRATKSRPSGKLGIKFVWDGRKGSRVKVGKIHEDGSLKNTELKVGQTVLAINSTAVLNPEQAGSLVGASGPEVFITSLCAPTTKDPPFCKLVSAPTSREHPGISFDSSRKRCLVQVARVFSHGPFAGSVLRQGDIVLAVNGVPVSKPEEAEQVLLQSLNLPNTVLYVVDMAEYRRSILTELQTTQSFRNNRLERIKSNSGDQRVCLKTGAAELTNLEVDYEKQYFFDSKSHGFCGTRSRGPRGRRYQKTYTRFVLPFLEAFNSRMEERMLILEEAVFCEAWNHGISNTECIKISPAFEIGTSHQEVNDNESYLPSTKISEMEPPLASATLVATDHVELIPCAQSLAAREQNCHPCSYIPF